MEGSSLATNGLETGTPQRRGVGRPSTVVQYAAFVAHWLRDDPTLSGAEILRRVRLEGYRGGKSALYELVKRLRPLVPTRPGTAPPSAA